MMPSHVFPDELKAVGRRNPIWQCDPLYRGFGVLGSKGTTRAGIETAAIAEADYEEEDGLHGDPTAHASFPAIPMASLEIFAAALSTAARFLREAASSTASFMSSL